MPDDGSIIPRPLFEDLDLDDEAGEEELERRVMVLAARRLAQARRRLESMGVIDAAGNLTSRELPRDMLPGSDASIDTG